LEEVFINPLPLPPQGFRTSTTPAHPALSLSFSASSALKESGDRPGSIANLENKNRDRAAIATRMMMDRQLVRQCDMEVMKMAMLRHEETFRQQVIKFLGGLNHQETLGSSSSSSFFLSS
jgi:hypothetical protein